MTKRIQVFLAGAFIAVGSLCAQSSDTDWKSQVAKLKETIQSNPEQAEEEAKELIKGKNKKNIDLLIAIGRAYLDADNLSEAKDYASRARKVDGKSAAASLLEGDIAIKEQDAGKASQKYEEAIYFDPHCTEAYLKYADIYKASNSDLAIQKLQELKALEPDNIEVERKLAEIYYYKNDFKSAIGAYATFAAGAEATEEDLSKYAFALFLNHEFDKSLEIVNKGLQKNANNAAFNRLAMYNYTDLKQFDLALQAADKFFKECDKADYSYLDYKYYGFLLSALKQYDDAVKQFEKAIEMDSTQTDLYKEISSAYEDKEDYKKAVAAYKKYFDTVETQGLDLQFQLGRLYYGAGTQKDSLTITPEERKGALMAADSVFTTIAELAPDNHLGNFWRARTNAALDPETTQGLAKPFYEEVAKLLESKNEARYKSALIECYKYLGYYYLLAIENPALQAEAQANKDKSIEYWEKILAIDPTDAIAKQALGGLK